MNKKMWIGVIAGALIVVPIVFNKVASTISAKMAAKQQARPSQVEVEQVYVKEIYPQTESVGRIEAKYSVDVVARINGWLEKRYFQEGAYVKKGQTLFLIQPKEYVIAVAQAKAALRQSEATLINAEKELKRAEELVKNDFVSKSYYDQALATRDQSKASLDVNKANLAAAQLNLSYTKITSPVDGKVGKILITEGNLVNAQTGPLTKIVSTTPIYAYFNIKSEEYLNFMRTSESKGKNQFDNTVVTLKLSDGTEYLEKGKLEFVNNEVDPTAGTIALRAVFENKDRLLVPGDFVNVTATAKTPVDVTVVPQVAVSDSTNGSYVWVVDENNKAQQRFIKIANQVGDAWIVTEGLEPNETVVTAGFQRLMPGASVIPIVKTVEEENNTSAEKVDEKTTEVGETSADAKKEDAK